MADWMDALLGLVGGGATIANAVTNHENSNTARDIGQQTLANQQALQEKLLQLATSKVTDARGNSTGYDPTRGWFTDLSPLGQQLQTGQDQATVQRMAGDVPLRDAATSGALTAAGRLAGPSPYSRAGITGDIANSSIIGLNQGYRNVTDPAVTNAMRTGTSAAPILASLASREGEDYSKALSNANVQGAQTFENLENSRTGRDQGLFSGMGSMADTLGTGSGISDVGVNSTLTNTQNQQRAGAEQTGATSGFQANQAGQGAGNLFASTSSGPGADVNLSSIGAGTGALFQSLFNRKNNTTNSGAANSSGGTQAPAAVG